MPYTCVRYQRLRGCSRRRRYGRALVVGGVASVASRGALAGGGARRRPQRARRRVDREAPRRPSARWRQKRARASSGRSAAFALSPGSGSLARTPASRGNLKGAKPTWVSLFDRPTCVSAAVSSLSAQQGIQNGRARYVPRRCCTLNKSLSCITFDLPSSVADLLAP